MVQLESYIREELVLLERIIKEILDVRGFCDIGTEGVTGSILIRIIPGCRFIFRYGRCGNYGSCHDMKSECFFYHATLRGISYRLTYALQLINYV